MLEVSLVEAHYSVLYNFYLLNKMDDDGYSKLKRCFVASKLNLSFLYSHINISLSSVGLELHAFHISFIETLVH